MRIDKDVPVAGLDAKTHADALIARLCETAWQQVPELTARLQAAGYGPGNWPTWDQLVALPLLRKSSFAARQAQHPPLGGLAREPHGASTLFMSPGGILEPTLPTAQARLADLLRQAGLQPDDIVLNGFSYHFTPAGLLFHDAITRLGAICLPGGAQNSELLLQFMHRARATGFVGIGSHLQLLIQQAEERGWAVGRELPLRIALVGAEPGAEELRKQLRQQYGIHCFDLYGTADVGLVAGDCPEGGLHMHPDVLAEVLDPVEGSRLPDGQIGELVLTVDNPEYPMLRYATGDLSRLLPEPCRCGLHTPRISSILGRADRSARVRGMLLYEHEIRQMVAGFPDVRHCRVDLTRDAGRDRLAATLMLSASSWDQTRIAQFLDAFRLCCRLRLDAVCFSQDVDEFQSGLLQDRRKLNKVG